jgi:hypothetical protein
MIRTRKAPKKLSAKDQKKLEKIKPGKFKPVTETAKESAKEPEYLVGIIVHVTRFYWRHCI